VPTVQKFRKGLPESTSVYVCKNSLMRVATEGEDKGQWQLLGKDTEVGGIYASTLFCSLWSGHSSSSPCVAGAQMRRSIPS